MTTSALGETRKKKILNLSTAFSASADVRRATCSARTKWRKIKCVAWRESWPPARRPSRKATERISSNSSTR